MSDLTTFQTSCDGRPSTCHQCSEYSELTTIHHMHNVNNVAVPKFASAKYGSHLPFTRAEEKDDDKISAAKQFCGQVKRETRVCGVTYLQ